MTTPWYCTREDVRAATEAEDTSSNNASIDNAVAAATRDVEKFLHRVFWPRQTTKYFDWPVMSGASTWRVWLNEHEVISVSSLVSAGTAITSNKYFLEPVNSGPPYNRIEIDLATSSSFNTGSTYQRNVSVTGLFGYSDDSASAGTLASGINDTAGSLTASDSSLLGVGDLLQIGTERMVITGRSLADTGAKIAVAGDLTSSKSDVLVALDSANVHAGEQIRIDAELMTVVDVAGSNLIVNRSQGGSVLAAHAAGATVYAPRTVNVLRGSGGTTAASHSGSATMTRWLAPGPVHDLTLAEALVKLGYQSSQYSKQVGVEGNTTVIGTGLAALREQVYTGYGRKNRMRAV